MHSPSLWPALRRDSMSPYKNGTPPENRLFNSLHKGAGWAAHRPCPAQPLSGGAAGSAAAPLASAVSASADTFVQSSRPPHLLMGQYFQQARPMMFSTGRGPQMWES